MARICGWQLPGYPKYICIEEEHGPEVNHQPKWYSDRLREAALRVVRAQLKN